MRRLTVLVTVLMLVIGGAAPAFAGHGDPVDGVWRATDLDGSKMMVSIKEHANDTGYFTVVLTDSRATGACTPAARMEAITTGSLYDDGSKVLFAHFSDIECSGRPLPSQAVSWIDLTAERTSPLSSFDTSHRYGCQRRETPRGSVNGVSFRHARGHWFKSSLAFGPISDKPKQG